jgi:endonuclease/exonuclease/phosphatase (EEP) superfamily protein YafD
MIMAARIAAHGLRVWIIVGLLLRLTRLRDAFQPLALVFYTTPWPVMAAGFVVLALHHRRLNHQHRFHRYAIFTGGALFTWIMLSWFSNAPSPSPKADAVAFRVVEWNVARPDQRFSSIVSWLEGQDADLIALAEAHGPDYEIADRWAAAFPGYQVATFPGEMACLVRGEIVQRDSGDLGSGASYAFYRVRLRNGELSVLQADLAPAPFRSRRDPLRRLCQIARSHEHERLVILGDFNTPRESALLDPFRTQFTHCFEAAGSGLAETWPMPLPALSLDQIWSSASLHPQRVSIGWPLLSDHRPVTADFAP